MSSDLPAAPSVDLLARAFHAAPNGFVMVDREGLLDDGRVEGGVRAGVGR